MQTYLIKLVGTQFTMTVVAASPEEAASRHFPTAARAADSPACRFDIELAGRKLGILVLPLINDARIEQLMEESGTVLSADDIRLFIAIEEITLDELSDTEFMLERLDTWEES